MNIIKKTNKPGKSTKTYLKKKKRKIQKKDWDRYKNLSDEENEKKCQYFRDQTENLREEEKQKKVEYMRNYYLTPKK